MTTDNLTPEEIREGNALIAEHMGLKLVYNDISGWCIEKPHNKLVSVNMIGYASDWEKMIPAWAKVQKQMLVIVRGSIYNKTLELHVTFYKAVNDDDKPSAFRTLVAAIKLLNQKTK